MGSPQNFSSELTEIRESFQDSNMDQSLEKKSVQKASDLRSESEGDIFDKIQSIRQTTESALNSDPINTSTAQSSINFAGLLDQQSLLLQLKEMFESKQIHPDKGEDLNALYGYSAADRQKIQNLCQSWWDSTQEDQSFFHMAKNYQNHLQEAYFNNSLLQSGLEMNDLMECNEQIRERGVCMRKVAILSTIVIGLTAFESMLVRTDPFTEEKKRMEVRNKISSCLKICYDQFILSISYALGKLNMAQVKENSSSPEAKMLDKYEQHFHMLKINKKIQSELDYKIFNDRGEVITNEINRDYQLGELSKRLQKILDDLLKSELQLQLANQCMNNSILLQIMIEICQNSAQIDFQGGKNSIYEAIANSEVMPAIMENEE